MPVIFQLKVEFILTVSYYISHFYEITLLCHHFLEHPNTKFAQSVKSRFPARDYVKNMYVVLATKWRVEVSFFSACE